MLTSVLNPFRIQSSLKTLFYSSKGFRIVCISFIIFCIARMLVPYTGCRFWETIWPHPEAIQFWHPRHDLYVNYCSKYDVSKTEDISSFTISASELFDMDLSNVGTTNNVPKILHQQQGSRVEFPSYLAPLVKTCGSNNAEWIHVVWTDSDYPDFLKKLYPTLWPMFRDFAKDIQRWDTIRFFILYHFGGVYVDTDVQCLSSLESWILDFKDYECLLEPVHIMSSPKNHNFWMTILHTIEKSNQRIYGGFLVDEIAKEFPTVLCDRSESKFREKHLDMLGVSAWKWRYHQQVGEMVVEYLLLFSVFGMISYSIWHIFRKPLTSRRADEEENRIFLP